MAAAGGIVTYPDYKQFGKPTAALVRAFRELESFVTGGLDDVLSDLRRTGNLDRFEEDVLTHLQESHTRGVVLGRNWAGDLAPRELDDELFAGRAVEAELEYFEGLMADLRAGRYDQDGGGYASGLDNRLQMYGRKVGGTMSETYVLASPAGDKFAWVMLADEHCEDCPRWAAAGPYEIHELPAYPRDGRSQCRVNCKCVLVRASDGMPSPPPFGLL